MLVTFPIVTPRVPPAKVRAEKGRKQLVAVRLIVIRAKPREGVIETNVPRITKAARHNLQIGAIRRATQNAAGQPPIVLGIVIVFLVGRRRKGPRFGQIRRAWRPHAPQLPKGTRRYPIGQMRQTLGIALGHVELTVRRPVQAVKTVLKIP